MEVLTMSIYKSADLKKAAAELLQRGQIMAQNASSRYPDSLSKGQLREYKKALRRADLVYRGGVALLDAVAAIEAEEAK